MSTTKLTRRSFLKLSALTAMGAALAACAQPAPTKAPAAPTKPAAAAPTQPAAAAATAKPATAKYSEAPMLADLVKAGKLPPVDQRLPEDPLVLPVLEEIGQYGGTWRRAYRGISDRWGPTKVVVQDFWMYWQDLSIRPNVISKFEANADATQWTIYMRKGMKWSDGQDYNTDDIAFWRDAVWKNKTLTPSPEADEYFSADGKPMVVDIIDKYTFKLTFAKSNPLTAIRTWCWDFPEHYMKQYHPDYVAKDVLDKAVKDAGVDTWDKLWETATGKKFGWWVNPDLPVILPWRCKVPPPAEVCEIERNPYFWQVDKNGNQLPYIDKVTHRLFESPDVFSLWLINGEIDSQARHVSPAWYTLLKENEKKGDYRVLICKQSNTMSFQPNESCTDKALADIFMKVDFRHAMSVAINREEINQVVWKGLFEPRQACPVSGSPQFDAEWEKKWTNYSPDEANKLLDGLGLKWDAAHKLRLRPDGKPLEMVFEAAEPDAANTDMWGLIVKYLNAVGIGATMKAVQRSLYEARELTAEIQVGTWVADMSLLPMKDPAMYTGMMKDNPYMSHWALWRETGGKQGAEPPADHPIRKIWQLWDETRVAPTLQAATDKFKQLMDIDKENIWQIGIAGEGPHMIVTKNNFRNILGGFAVDDPIRDDHVMKPAQYFKK